MIMLCQIRTALFVFAVAFFALFASDEAFSQGQAPEKLSGAQLKQWQAKENALKADLSVCLEHCGGNKDCEAGCKKAFDARLSAAYRSLAGTIPAPPPQDIARHPSCPFCGMDREKFKHSRMVIVFEDGTESGTCSIHCAALELAINIDKSPSGIWVGDYETGELIDTEAAFWVIGGGKPGVMTRRAKWAFKEKDGAERFINSHGGREATIDEAFKASFEDMYADTKMIIERRKMKRGLKK